MTRISSAARRSSLLLLGSLAGAVTAAPLVGCSSDDSTPAPAADAGTDAATTPDATADSGGAALPFTISNIDLSGVDLSKVEDIDITSNCVFQYSGPGGITDCGDFVYAYLTQSDQSGVGVYIAKSIHIEPGVVVTATSGRPLAVVSLGSFLVQGTVDVSADDLPGSGGAGGYNAPDGFDVVGLGPGGGAAGTSTQSAGGGSYCGVGGTGANVTPGGATVAGGIAWGTAAIVPLVGGASGGNAETGGGGGGAMQLVAGTTFTLASAGELAAGGGPGNGSGDATQQAGGGGSGGAILIEAPTVTVAGTLSANGGGGGGTGHNGTPADLLLTAAAGGGTTGGAGSAGTSIAGVGGTTPTDGSDPGAGGGGAGRIRINTTSGVATLTGTFSPDVTTTCVTQGTVGH